MWTRINQTFTIPPEVRSVVTELTQAGFETYLVGGCVRDWLRGQPVQDFDVATAAKPADVEKVFPDANAVGKAFGVMRVGDIEVATFRTESDYRDHRHPSKVSFTDVKGDAARRDFTVNALYYDLKTSQVLDFFGGLADLQSKTLRAIGNPETRFKEDALRLLRAVRFSSKFGFLIEEKTRAAIQAKSSLIRKISIERIRIELEKILVHPSCKSAFLELDALGLLENVMPELSVAKLADRKVWDQTLRGLRVLSHYTRAEPIAFYWAITMLPTFRVLPIDQREQEAKKFAERMKFSQETTSQLMYLVRETPKFRDAFSMREATLLRWMREPDFELLLRFHELEAAAFDGNVAGLEFARSIYPEAKRRFEIKALITGDDLVKLGMRPGRQFSEILRTVEDLTLEGKLTTSDQALEYVLQHFVR